MTDRAELENLSSKALHDRAVSLAERRLDVGFLWKLLKSIPVAQAAAGHLPEAEADVAVADLVPLLHDFTHSGEGDLADALRPMYIDYLAEHEKARAMTIDVEAYRAEFPVLEKKAYLISASLGPVSTRARRYLDQYVDAWATEGAPDPVWMDHIFPQMGRLKDAFAGLIGATRDELAITVNVSLALANIMSCIDFGKRRKIVLSELDFPTDGHVALAHRRRGAEVVFLESPDGITVPVEAYLDAIDDDTALVIVNRVLYRTSSLIDAKRICRKARQAGAWTVVDDFHGAGIVPVDVHDLGCDFYTTGVLKWLCGGPGLTFLYCREALLKKLEPLATGWFATREPFSFDLQHLDYQATARRLENGTPPAPIAFIAQGGLDIITEVGPAAIRERQQDLIDYVVARADEAGLPVRSPRDRERRGGMVNVGVGTGAEKVCHALLDRDVCTDYRGDGIRVSPHFFNTEQDVDRLFEALREVL